MCVNMKVLKGILMYGKSFSNILRTFPKKGSRKPNEEVEKSVKNCQNCEQIVWKD